MGFQESTADERDTEPPPTNPDAAGGSLAHIELWKGLDNQRGYTIATPDGFRGSGPIGELVGTLRLLELLPPAVLEPPPAPPAPKAHPARGRPDVRNGYWPGSMR